MGKLDAPARKQVAKTIDALARGDENLQSHQLRHPLKGWSATKASRGHRVIHKGLDDGTLHIGYVGLHEYEAAERRLGALGLTAFFRQAAPNFDLSDLVDRVDRATRHNQEQPDHSSWQTDHMHQRIDDAHDTLQRARERHDLHHTPTAPPSAFPPPKAPQPAVHRGVSVVLPADKHRFIHDSAQPLPARAHMLLSEIKKQHTGISGEEHKGGTGGLGEFWTPDHDTAHRYGNSAGDDTYRDHENAHSCGHPSTGEGGCPTTTVVMHADEPPAEHHWNEVYRPGESYNRDVSWRLPVRPGAPVNVHGISWHQGEHHLPGNERDQRAETRGVGADGNYKLPNLDHHYDFSHTVEKHSSLISLTDHFRKTSDEEGDVLRTLQAEAAAQDHSDGVMVALVPPADIAEQLAHEDGQPADDLHVTLAYLGKVSDYTPEQLQILPQVVSSWAVRQKPVDVRIGGVGKFSNPAEDQHVLWASADIPGGAQLHADLARYLEGHGFRLPSEHGWSPHMTLRYVDKHFRFMPHVPEHRWTASAVTTFIGGTRHQNTLGTSAQPDTRHIH
ncbi:2'-5' RNA ligase family protein [Streptomyces albidoflavus]|uniref:2'-5' RNA ligase family protein n=1 Tax=Streptomyces albidoflavus TaxID=1886 RepID=UPI0033C38222